MIKFPSIESLRHVRDTVKARAKYHGADSLPTIDYVGTVKLHGCVSADTLVTLADGSVTSINNIAVGTSILSYDTNINQYVIAPVTNIIIKDIPQKEWIRVTFENGRHLDCTTDHKVFTKNRGWVEASMLTYEDELVEDLEEPLS